MAVKILVVDDEPDVQPLISQIFRRQISRAEYEFTFALDGLEALAKLREDPAIAILLTDIKMPKMDGLALLAKVVQLKSSLNPVLTPLVLSAYDDMANIRRAMNEGAFDFLTKPLDPQDLRLTLRKTIQHIERLHSSIEQEEQARTTLQKMNEALEQRVKERTAALEAANTALKASNAELDAFAHTVAHNLKGPLGVIVSYIELLVENGLELSREERLDVYQSMNRSGRKAMAIVDELLLLAGVRKGVASIKPLNMGQVVEQALERLAFMSNEYQASIIVPPAWPTVKGYAPWVEEIWVNYLSNGLKYGGRPPHLELGFDAGPEGLARFWIKDNGPGLTLAEQETLFVEFARLNTTQISGHGLGLSIVRRIVEKLGGVAGVNNAPDGGSLFYFTLPLQE